HRLELVQWDNPIARVASYLRLPCRDKKGRKRRVKRYWEIVRGNLRKEGWNCGCTSSTNCDGRQFCLAAAERGSAGRLVVHAHRHPRGIFGGTRGDSWSTQNG